MTSTLVFPSSVAAALDYAREAAARGERVVGASSLPWDDNAPAFSAWERLPSIHEEGFLEGVLSLVAKHGLTHAYVPSTTAHRAVERLIEAGRLTLKLVHPNPIAQQNNAVGRLFDHAGHLHRFAADVAGDASTLPILPHFAAMLRYANLCYGESSDVKLAAMVAVASTSAKGDVVEIGTLMGKSASVLVMSARLFDIGRVLTVDPWMPAPAKQKDSPSLVQEIVDLWNFDLLSAGFFLNMIPIASGWTNHLRLPSEDAFAVYERQRRVETPELGTTEYAGRIALLHIDGNHDLAAVRQDLALWGRRMIPGGWIIFDDYTWMHGAGPRIIGDQLLDDADAWQRAFVCGGALFVQLAGRG